MGLCKDCKWWQEFWFGTADDGRCLKANKCGWKFYLVPYGDGNPVLMTAGTFSCNQFDQRKETVDDAG